MPAAARLPRKLRGRLAELGQRLRRMQIIQGMCRLVAVILLSALACVLLDGLVHLPGWMRGLLFGSWIVLCTLEIRRFIRGPLSQPLDAEGLASAVEQEFPRLGERLTTAVELAGSRDPANGSPELIDVVIRDAENRTRKLDLKRAAPATTTIGFAIAGFVAIFAVLIPLVAVPRAGEHARRFFAPWYAPKSESTFTIKITSGDPTVKRGENTTLTALIEPIKPNGALPTTVTAVIKTDKGIEKLPMTFDPDKREAFLTRGPVEAGFDYQVASGEVETEWRHVTVVDPVRLEHSQIKILPPAYARKTGEEPVPMDGLPAELNALQYSKITYELRFNRMPSAAWLEWKPDDDSNQAASNKTNLSVNADLTATVTVPVVTNGEFRFQAEVDKVRTSFAPQRLVIQIDTPPKFERQEGVVDKPLSISPSEKLEIDCTVGDDISISKLEVEYRINGGEAKTESIATRGIGTSRAIGHYAFKLEGKIKEGEFLEYRLAATDNRNVPGAKLTPQTTYYPENNWAKLQLKSTAAPLKEQNINAKKDEIDARLQEIIEDLKKEQRAAYGLKIDSAGQASFKPEQADKLKKLLKSIRETTERTDELARDIGLTPDLGQLAESVRNISAQELNDAETALQKTQTEDKQSARKKDLEKADKSLEEAIRKLEELRKTNERAAKERLDKQRLDQLAEEQKKLAEQAAKADKDKLDEIKRQQKELEERLKKLQEDSEPLKNALEKLQAQELEKMAGEAQRLEQELRDLTQAMQEAERKSLENRMADLKARQDELSKRAQKLAEKTDTAARTAPISPLKPEEIKKAADELNKGNVNDAIDRQERAAFELDRLAKELERAVERSKDPREAARQLERLQEDLRQKVAEATKDTPLDKLPKARRESFQKQQEAIKKAAEKLSVPQDSGASKTRDEAVKNADDATDSLTRDDAKNADESMRKAREALAKLAEQMPSLEKRLAQAKAETAKLKQEQEAIAKQAEQNAKQLEKQDPDAAATQSDLAKKNAELAKRQSQLAGKIGKLDVPGQENRRDKAQDASQQAQDDLEKGRPRDIASTQQAAKRELERLEQALGGQTPPDEQADRLAKKQKQLAEEMKQAAAKGDSSKQKELQQQQAQQTQDIQKLPANEAGTAKDNALELSRKTENAKSGADAAKQSQETADALQKLADQLNGRESEAEKADRLAKKQHEAAEEADRLAKKKENNAELRKKTQQMQEEAKNLRPGENGQKDAQKAIDALNRAQQANNPEQLSRAEKEAADALKQLAEKLSRQQAANKPARKQDPEKLEGLPNQAEADEARQLAQEQRKLRDELARANEEMNKKQEQPAQNPLSDLVKEQEKVAAEASELAKNLNDKQGEAPESKQAQQGADAAKQASSQLKNGLIDTAKQAGQQAAQKFQQMAQSDPKKQENKQAGELARRQEEINKKLESVGKEGQAGQAQQADRQKDLEKQIGELKEKIDQLGGQMKEGMPSAKTREAGERGQEAADAMKNARNQGAKGDKTAARQSQNQAAESMKQAGQALKNAAGQLSQNPKQGNGQGNQQAGQSLQQAQQKMGDAKNQLGQGRQQQAGKSMQQAADSMKQAAGQMGRANQGNASQPQPGEPNQGSDGNGNGTDKASKPTDLSKLDPLTGKYNGKSWGELSGEIKTQILTEAKARYGEDYSRYIKLYFEQLAEQNK